MHQTPPDTTRHAPDTTRHAPDPTVYNMWGLTWFWDDLKAIERKCWSDDVQTDRHTEFQLVDSTSPVGGVEWKVQKRIKGSSVENSMCRCRFRIKRKAYYTFAFQNSYLPVLMRDIKIWCSGISFRCKRATLRFSDPGEMMRCSLFAVNWRISKKK